MRLASFGCSFIFGTDLADSQNNSNVPSLLTWPALLANNYDMDYKCYAGGGLGNLMILDRLTQSITEDPSQFFVVQWTFIDRFDYSDPSGHHFNGKNTNDYCSLLPGDDDFNSNWYYSTLHSEYKDKFTSLIYMKTAIDELTKHNCRFLMTCVDDLIWCDRYHINDTMKAWQKNIKPHMSFFENQNFLSWCKKKCFALSPGGHPLEQAHIAAADLMMPTIDTILHKV